VKCKVTIERVSRETYEMELEGDCVQVLDQARAMVARRNRITQADTTFVVKKVESIKE
jgi:hypothetical protein